MIIAVIVLAWLLLSTWTTLIIVGIDEKWAIDEWAGMVVACITSPICFFIIRPVVLAVRRARRKRQR